MKQRFFICLLAGLFCSGISNAQVKSAARYTKVPTGYLMVLQPGDTLFSQLRDLARKENIPSANFTGMGFAEVTFGSFDPGAKTYRPRHFKPAELASMHGSIAWQNDTVSIHAHGVIGDKKCRAYGGHMLTAVVGKGTLEIMILVHDRRLERVKDPQLGANVICLDHCR